MSIEIILLRTESNFAVNLKYGNVPLRLRRQCTFLADARPQVREQSQRSSSWNQTGRGNVEGYDATR